MTRGARLRLQRKVLALADDLKWSDHDLARALGCHPDAVYKWRRGTTVLTQHRIVRNVRELLNRNVHELLKIGHTGAGKTQTPTWAPPAAVPALQPASAQDAEHRARMREVYFEQRARGFRCRVCGKRYDAPARAGACCLRRARTQLPTKRKAVVRAAPQPAHRPTSWWPTAVSMAAALLLFVLLLYTTGCDESSSSSPAPPEIQFFGLEEDYPERDLPPATMNPGPGVPEPAAKLAFGFGALVVGWYATRKRGAKQ